MKIPKGDYDKPEIAPAWLPIEDTAGQPLKPSQVDIGRVNSSALVVGHLPDQDRQQVDSDPARATTFTHLLALALGRRPDSL